jgi:hypothetical protein
VNARRSVRWLLKTAGCGAQATTEALLVHLGVLTVLEDYRTYLRVLITPPGKAAVWRSTRK